MEVLPVALGAAAVLVSLVVLLTAGIATAPSRPRPTAIIPSNPPPVATSASLSPTATIAGKQDQVPTSSAASVPISSGYSLAFASDKDGTFDVYLTDSATDAFKRLARPPGYDVAIWPSFCGNAIAAELQDTREVKAQWIYLLDPATGQTSRWDSEGSANELGVPRCSPNAQYMAYSARVSGKWQMRIDSFPQGNHLLKVSDDSITGYASWLGSRADLLYMSYELGMFRTHMMQGLNPEQTSEVAPSGSRDGKVIDQWAFPAISPDGSQMAFVCEIAAENWLCLTDLASGTTEALQRIIFAETRWDTWSIVSAGTPAWSADGSWLYFSSADTGDFDIYRIRRDGGGKENITGAWTSNEIMPTTR